MHIDDDVSETSSPSRQGALLNTTRLNFIDDECQSNHPSCSSKEGRRYESSPRGNREEQKTSDNHHEAQEGGPQRRRLSVGQGWAARARTEVPSDSDEDSEKGGRLSMRSRVSRGLRMLSLREKSEKIMRKSGKGAVFESKFQKIIRQQNDIGVKKYYDMDSSCAKIASNLYFEYITITIIGFNAVWIGFASDHNPSADIFVLSPIEYIVVENVFCYYFAFEVIIRFSSYKIKRQSLSDRWFVFDAILVACMILETWIFPFVLKVTEEGIGRIPPLFRMIRLIRLTRIVRLMRAFPELMVLIKGMLAATRSVFITLFLLMVVLYLFSIIFKMFVGGEPEFRDDFGSLVEAAYYLITRGTLLDNCTPAFRKLRESENVSWMLWVMFLFVLFSAFTILNMLIGVLCEVASSVKVAEKEKANWSEVCDNLTKVFKKGGRDKKDFGLLCRDDFEYMASENWNQLMESLAILDIEPKHLSILADAIFVDDSCGQSGSQLRFDEFIEAICYMRPGIPVAVLDVAKLGTNLYRLAARLTRHIEVAEKTLRTKLSDAMSSVGKNRQKPVRGENQTMIEAEEMKEIEDLKIRILTERDRADRASKFLDELNRFRAVVETKPLD